MPRAPARPQFSRPHSSSSDELPRARRSLRKTRWQPAALAPLRFDPAEKQRTLDLDLDQELPTDTADSASGTGTRPPPLLRSSSKRPAFCPGTALAVHP